MQFSLFTLLISLALSISCSGPADPLYPDLDLPVLGTVGMHARDLPDPKIVVNLFGDGRLTLNGRAAGLQELEATLAREGARDMNRENPQWTCGRSSSSGRTVASSGNVPGP